MVSELLSKEQLAEIEQRLEARPLVGYLTTALSSLKGGEEVVTLVMEDVPALLTQLKAVEAERDDLLNRSHQTVFFNCGCVFEQEGLDTEPDLQHCNTVEAFRRRAATKLRALGDEFDAPEYYAAADIVESLPATEEVGDGSTD